MARYLGDCVIVERVRRWSRLVKRDAVAVSLAARDPRVPWYAKTLAAAVGAYALSPIDLIPDFIPVLGYLDDLLLVPAGIFLTVRLIPDGLMAEFHQEAAKRDGFPVSRTGAIVIVALWVATLTTTAWWLLSL